MFFVVLTAFIVYSLATFGAVHPKDWWLIGISLTVVLSVLLIKSAMRESNWRGSVLVL